MMLLQSNLLASLYSHCSHTQRLAAKNNTLINANKDRIKEGGNE